MKRFILIGVPVLVIGAVFWYVSSLRPVDARSDVRQTVTVASGLSVAEIADLLKKKNLIRSPSGFKVFVKLQGKESALQAGKFVLRPSMPVREIVEVLQDGKADEMIVTIPEGFSVRDIDELLAQKGIIEEGEIMRCVQDCDFFSFEFLPPREGLAQRAGRIEGYLYPDTYYIEVEEFVPKFFLERLMTTFRHKIIEPLETDIAASDRSLHEIVTMASLIEKETRTDAERTVVAGILWKRFDAGLGLGVDATVRYITDNPTDPITTADLNDNSPYNTRKFKGLPPGPIASPSYKSILAAIHPQESSYWYYLHGDDGQIRYAETNEEHNINRHLHIR